MSQKAVELSESLERDGFVILRNFLNAGEVTQARKEIEDWAQIDLEDRKKANVPESAFTGRAGYTHLNSGKQLLIDFFTKSPTLDRLFDQLLTNPAVSQVLERLGGKHLKLRGYNIRYMTGQKEYSAMEWHRDNPGEINLGIILSETEPLTDASTCFVPGSHLYPYCPFKSTMFSMPFPAPPPPKLLSTFSRKLQEKTLKNTADGAGKPGDCYIFLGDTWHARRPNLNGKRGMVLLVGLFPTEVPFPTHTEVIIPSTEVLDRLPPSVRKIVDYKNSPVNPTRDSYIHKIEVLRQKRGFLTLWHLAEIEKRLSGLRIGRLIANFCQNPFYRIKRFLWLHVKQRFLKLKRA